MALDISTETFLLVSVVALVDSKHILSFFFRTFLLVILPVVYWFNHTYEQRTNTRHSEMNKGGGGGQRALKIDSIVNAKDKYRTKQYC